jgi:hypothetical protein
MQDPQEFDDLRELAPYLEALKRLQGLDYAAGLSLDGWKELARVLAETSRTIEHARRIVDQFITSPRYDSDGELVTKVPTPIELRIFARGVSEQEMPNGELPAPCHECAAYAGRFRIVTRNGIEAADRCTCDRGDALRERDQARGSQMPVKRAKIAPMAPAADIMRRVAGDLD